MAGIVRLSAIWNKILALFAFITATQEMAGNQHAQAYHSFFFGVFLLYTSATLMLAARDLPQRASIVFWEGYLRFAAALILVTLGPNAIGPVAWPLAMADFAWGVIYQAGLCRVYSKSYLQLLLDQSDEINPAPAT
ncbi:MAG: hypothetical protein ACKO5E_05335 [bacterium]